MAGRSRGDAPGTRGVVAQIDARLKDVEAQIARHEQLVRERERLRAARSTLLGEGPSGQITQDDVAAYLSEHPGSRPRQIASALGVSAGRVSAHLFRGKSTRFVSRGGEWYVREQKRRGGPR